MIQIASKRSASRLKRSEPSTTIVDVTSKGLLPWQRFSPFFPHGGIPVPFSPGLTAQSVEGIWQGLKVFRDADVDPSTFQNATMKNIKRTTRRFGPCLGHRRGTTGKDLLDYRTARYEIYLPSYRWVLENRLESELAGLHASSQSGDLVLLDYETNGDVEDLTRPLSHAALIRAYLLDAWPVEPSTI